MKIESPADKKFPVPGHAPGVRLLAAVASRNSVARGKGLMASRNSMARGKGLLASRNSVAHGKGLLVATILVAGLLCLGCSRSQDQVAFEREAFRQPSGFTETRADGEIVSRDERDWQIGPMFQGYVEVFTPPFPNPTRGERVRLELDISGLGVVEGLVAIGFYEMFDARTRRVLNDEYAWNRLDPGLYVIDINPAEFDRTNSYSAARQINNGLHRLFIYDNRNNLITYGDIKLD